MSSLKQINIGDPYYPGKVQLLGVSTRKFVNVVVSWNDLRCTIFKCLFQKALFSFLTYLKNICFRRVPLAGSIASFQQPSTGASSNNQQIDEEIQRPLTTYQDIMHNLLMKMPWYHLQHLHHQQHQNLHLHFIFVWIFVLELKWKTEIKNAETKAPLLGRETW